MRVIGVGLERLSDEHVSLGWWKVNTKMSTTRETMARLLIAVLLAAWPAAQVSAADQWIEVKSAHFTVNSNASERTTRRLVWQLEQVRSLTAVLWGGVTLDLNKPLSVLIVKDEHSMRALIPRYWEGRRSVDPASVWVTGPDQHYLALRGDVEVQDRGTINPYMSAYSAYVGLLMTQSLGCDAPLWFTSGLTRVLSNTIVNEDHVLLGAPIPWELQVLRERSLFPLSKLLTITRSSRESTEPVAREVFDAEAWGFVHFLMFGAKGARAAKLDAFTQLLDTAKDPAAAFVETLGPVAALEDEFRLYYQRQTFTYSRIHLDVRVERERFPVRPLMAAEAALARAQFQAVMHQSVAARASIAEARKSEPQAPGSYVAEGLVADVDNKGDEAKAAYAKAAELGATSAYAYYRLASLTWQPDASSETLVDIEKQLRIAIRLNPRYAAAYAWLGEVRASLGDTDSMALIRRAISIEPAEAVHHVRAVTVLLGQGKCAEAGLEAQAALALAKTDEERLQAERLLGVVATTSVSAVSRPAALTVTPSSSSPSSSAAPADDVNALNTACQSGDPGACGRLLPTVEAECAQKNGSACGFAGPLYESSRGVTADATRAAAFYQQACDSADRMGCVGFALLQARGQGVTKDAAKAQATLTQICTDGMLEACAQLAVVIVAGGTPGDIARARELLTKACEGKHERACAMLTSLPKAPR